MCLFCLAGFVSAGASPANNQPVNFKKAASNAGLFNTVSHTASQQRVLLATSIYKASCRKMSKDSAMKCLDDLTAIARRLNDKPLECCVFELRADYYSVNTGFNPTSTAYYQKAIAFAAENNLAVETGVYQNKIALYYSIFKQHVPACKYYLQGMETFRQIGFDHVPMVSLYLTQFGNFYYQLGDYEDAMIYLTESLKYPIPTARIKINTLNTIGLIYRNNNSFARALSYFNTALNLSRQSRDTIWAAIATGNIGSVAFMQNRYDKAIPDITTDYETSLKYGENLNAVIALLRLVNINLINNKTGDASKQLNQAAYLISKCLDTLQVNITYYGLKALYYERTGNLAQSIVYHKKLELDKDKLQQSNNIAAVERVRLNTVMASSRMEVDTLRNAAKLSNFKRNAVIAMLFLLIIIGLLVYNQRTFKARQERELLLSQKRLVDGELKSAAAQLLIYTESLRQKNKLIGDFKKQVSSLEVKFDNRADTENLEKLLQAHIMTDEHWDEFKNLFDKVHTGFFIAVKKNFPNLSNTDTRILSLMKLRLSNREMANMLGITIEGIKKSKQRLRKKMELNADEDLDQVIALY